MQKPPSARARLLAGGWGVQLGGGIRGAGGPGYRGGDQASEEQRAWHGVAGEGTSRGGVLGAGL